jgi:C4-dicarboxylate-specific signal transduction histidine kinase
MDGAAEHFKTSLRRKQTRCYLIKTVERIAKIVQGLKTFSRDGSRDAFEEINAHSLISDTLSLCMERMRDHGVRFFMDPIDEKLTFQGRGTEISQVLVNLLNNADDAISKMPDKWISFTVQSEEKWLEFRVTDCGSGIPAEVQKSLFQPFFTTKEIGKGTGLGLSISHGIVQHHGGELKLDSQCPNTCFVLRLPKLQESMAQKKNAA